MDDFLEHSIVDKQQYSEMMSKIRYEKDYAKKLEDMMKARSDWKKSRKWVSERDERIAYAIEKCHAEHIKENTLHVGTRESQEAQRAVR